MREGSSPSTPTRRTSGTPRTPTLRAVDDDDARRHLADEQERLERLRGTIEDQHLGDEPQEDSSSELSHVDQHPADSASDVFEREKEFSILEQVEAELADVDRALARLDEGTYGRCEVCGEPIADERLASLPAARFCVEHQGDVET
jgi:RNA polymerase-binding transcription factor DksA